MHSFYNQKTKKGSTKQTLQMEKVVVKIGM